MSPANQLPLPARIVCLGFLNGARSLTPVAMLCWGARSGTMDLQRTPFAFLDNPISLGVFSLLAAGELVGDKLPQTPSRTAAFPLAGRLAFGAGCGMVLAASFTDESARKPSGLAAPALLGALGALAGSFAMAWARRSLTKGAGLPDPPVALAEDAAGLAGSHFLIFRS